MNAPAHSRLGDILVTQGSILRDALEAHATRARGHIGHYLCAHNAVSPQALAQGLATQHALRFAALGQHPPDAALFQPGRLAHYIAHHYVPYAHTPQCLTVATSEPSAALRDGLSEHYRTPVELVVTGQRDLDGYFASVGATAVTRRARLSLRRRHRALVADRTLLPVQSKTIALGFALLLLGWLLAPHTSWQLMVFVCNLFYLLSLAVKLQFYRQGQAQHREQQQYELLQAGAVSELEDAPLPIYTILVPLYHESSEVMAQLLSHLKALDYPREKLDIKLICEADDTATIEALKALQPPQTMHIIAVAPSKPRTKPKACNVALQQIRGEFVVIYDAEDAPAADQLKQAVAMFRRTGRQVACLQAPLNYYNRNENLLTQLFSIEYSALFRLNLPALERMRLPIPLGGTSNHLRVAALTEAGGWDAFNVTEDADLGIRLAYFGYRTCMLPSLTLEEAPISLDAWMRQRTRWIKGYIQTWLVYMRAPHALKKRLGRKAYYGFQFFVGAPALTFLLAPCFWLVYFLSLTGIAPELLSPSLTFLCAVSFFGGMFVNWLFARAVLRLEGWHEMRRALLVYPFYWLLHSVAAAKALYELTRRPHHWNKTRHGVSRFRPGPKPDGLRAA